MKRFITAVAVTATLTLGAAAQAATTISISTFDISAFNSMTVGGVVEDFESITAGPLTGPLSTSVGTFDTLGGTGSGSTCALNGTCEFLAVQNGGINGQGNLVPAGGSQSLNSNDTLGIMWDVSLGGGQTFSSVIFAILDGGEFTKLTVTAGGTSLTFGPGEDSGNAQLFVVDFGSAISAASITLANINTNDSFTFDGAVVDPIPLPAGMWLMLAGLGGLAAMKRRKAA